MPFDIIPNDPDFIFLVNNNQIKKKKKLNKNAFNIAPNGSISNYLSQKTILVKWIYGINAEELRFYSD